MKTTNQMSSKGPIVSSLKDSLKDRINRLSDTRSSDLAAGLYLVTTHFNDTNTSGSNEQKLQYVILSVPRVYNHILNKTVKHHHYTSRRKLHPYMLTFVDYSGSRFHQHNFTQLPHTHSILIVHPAVKHRFQELWKDGFRLNDGCRNTSCIQEIDVREIANTDDDLTNVISYSAKSYFLNYIPFVSDETKADMMVFNG